MAFYSSYKPQISGVSSLQAGTDTAVSTSTGAVTVWNTSTLQTITDRGSTTTNQISIDNITSATSTITGALIVAGGVGIGGNIYANAIYDSGYRVLTTSTLLVNSLSPGADISINTATGNVTVSNISTLQSVTDRGSTTTNIIEITNTATSTNTTSGALLVAGGVGIGGNLNTYGTITAGTQIYLKADSLDPANSSTFTIESTVPIGYSAFTIKNSGASGQSYTFDVGGNNRSLSGGTAIDEGNLTIRDDTNSAYRMVITKTGNILVNTSTDTGAQLQINGSVSIQGSLQETRVTLVNNTSATEVDSFVSSVYRSCKCLVQVQDGTDFHITEIVLLHDTAGQVYKSEYGIISTGGEKGTFTADLQLDGIVRLYFTADSISNKTISIVKTAIAI
jgi:hypothetical protein